MRMTRFIAAITVAWVTTAAYAGASAPFLLDTTDDPADSVSISWDASWIGGDTNATVVISDNGIEVRRATGVGEFTYTPSGIGRHELTYMTYICGVAQDEVYTNSVYAQWKYEVVDGGAVISGTTQTSGAVAIPSEIDGYSVTGIGAGVFAGCSNLTEVVIPARVWDIGEGAFADCAGLRRVELAKTLQGIVEEQGVFEGGPSDMEIIYVAPEIRNVTAKQRYPWNGKVDISFEVVGDVMAGLSPDAEVVLSLVATNRVSGSNYVAAVSAVSGDVGTVEGLHHVVWDLSAQGLEFASDDVVFSVSYIYVPHYCVIDLSAGANASSYPVSYLADVPSGGWTDEYKTTKLVLRRIEPGTFRMQNSYDVTLTKAFYCGVFEVTQKQYELVTGSNPSSYKGDMRPVEQVSWNTIRGNSSTYNWPGSTNVDSSTFIGRIQARTGLAFDLPTEAQWEYACRAGTTSAYNNGGDTESDLKLLGRYSGNYSDGKGGYTSAHTTVGSYEPNAWGLYDMHGSVWEWCLDWSGSLSGDVTDPVGSSSGSYRVKRGGSWRYNADSCASSFRVSNKPSVGDDNSGFRLVRTLSNIEGERSPEAVAGVEWSEQACFARRKPRPWRSIRVRNWSLRLIRLFCPGTPRGSVGTRTRRWPLTTTGPRCGA